MTKKLICPKCKRSIDCLIEISEEYSATPIIQLPNGEWEITSSIDKQLRYSETIGYECPICGHREQQTDDFMIEEET